MALLSTLQEASDTSLDDLKTVVSKDKRIKQILSKSLSIEDISNPKEFIDTLRFQILNNKNVIAFVKNRDGITATTPQELSRIRKIQAADLNEATLKQLQSFVQLLFKEISAVDRGAISSSARKEILDWVNSSGRGYDLSRATQRERATPPLRDRAP